MTILNEQLKSALEVEDYELADSLQNQIDNQTMVKEKFESLYKSYFEN